MNTSSSSYAVPVVAGALVGLCALALVRSYASMPAEPLRVALVHGQAGVEEQRTRRDAPLSARWFDEEDEVGMLAQRAAEAKEEVEEAREEAEEESGLSTARHLGPSTMLRAHIEVIATRPTESGVAPDPCVHSVPFSPAMRDEARPDATISLRTTVLAADGSDAETRHFSEVPAFGSCPLEGGFYLDDPRAATRIQLCPTSCAWVQRATHGVRVGVLASTR